MKKNYFLTLLVTFCFSFLSFGQSVLITGYVDAPCTGAKPRTVEIYVNGTVDFTGWKLIRQTNGKGFAPGSGSRGEIDISSLGTLSDTFAYITNDSAGLNSEFGISTNVIQNGNVNSNGDDAFQLINSSDAVIDRFGVDNEDATGKNWEHEDTYYYRKDGSSANAGSFDVANWTIAAKNLLDGKGTCNGQAALSTIVPFGSFKKTASTVPSLTITSPSNNQVFPSSTTNVPVNFSIANFTLSGDNGSEMSDNTGDGYIKGSLIKNGVADGTKNIFSTSQPIENVTPGSTYMITAELVDNNGNSLSPKVEVSATFSIELPCDLSIGNLEITCNTATTGQDNYQVKIPFTGGNTGTTYTIDTNGVGTIGGDNPDTTASGNIIIKGIAEGTSFTMKITGGAGSSCDIPRTINSPTCYPLPILETFSYTENQNLISNPLWQDASTSSTPNDIQVKLNDDGNGNPILGSYYGANILPAFSGNMVSLSGAGSDPYIGFENVTSGTVYASFTFHVTDMTNFNNSNGGYFAIFTENTGFRGRLWIKDPTAGATNEGLTFNLGISTGSTSTMHTGFTANLAEPVFVVLGYNLDSDEFKMWVVPDQNSFGTNTPPAASLTVTGATATSINRFLLRQDSNSETPSIDLDELRIGTSWKDVTSNPVASVGRNQILGFATYPNPINNGIFTVESKSTKTKEITIYNALGKKVLTSKFSGIKQEFNVANLNSGIYVLKVNEEGKTSTRKLVIK